jgi:hypothetical protein
MPGADAALADLMAPTTAVLAAPEVPGARAEDRGASMTTGGRTPSPVATRGPVLGGHHARAHLKGQAQVLTDALSAPQAPVPRRAITPEAGGRPAPRLPHDPATGPPLRKATGTGPAVNGGKAPDNGPFEIRIAR